MTFLKTFDSDSIKSKTYNTDLLEFAWFAKAISHPARLAILQYLAETKTCISGDISDSLPLSRSTVFQHLKELKEIGLIHGDIDGVKTNYCLCNSTIVKYKAMFEAFFKEMGSIDIDCKTDCK
jgi:DNA-binding transcriptional ArsR family regulator